MGSFGSGYNYPLQSIANKYTEESIMEEKIKNLMVAELLWTEEELKNSEVVKNTVNKVKRVMKDQKITEDTAISFVLFGDTGKTTFDA